MLTELAWSVNQNEVSFFKFPIGVSVQVYISCPPRMAHAYPLQANTLIVSHRAIPLRPAPWRTALVSPNENSTNRPCSSGLR